MVSIPDCHAGDQGSIPRLVATSIFLKNIFLGKINHWKLKYRNFVSSVDQVVAPWYVHLSGLYIDFSTCEGSYPVEGGKLQLPLSTSNV